MKRDFWNWNVLKLERWEVGMITNEMRKDLKMKFFEQKVNVIHNY